jgi:dethiobiotin synthetase/adenosylmethionine--8-amino-7-oxononanoate aminotransferase
MSIALGEASGRYGHVMFPQNLHPPAVQLASYMVNEGPGRGWADKVR